jgi:hypothetical protein
MSFAVPDSKTILLNVSRRACGARDHPQAAAHFLVHVSLLSAGWHGTRLPLD